MKLVERAIYENSQSCPAKTALRSGKETVSYRQLWQSIVSACQFFKSLPFYNPGGAVIISANKQLGFVYAYFGAHLARLRVVPIDAATSPARFAHISRVVDPVCIIGFDKMETDKPKLSINDFNQLPAVLDDAPNDFNSPDDIADILFTTGTTGEPKGVPLTYDNEAAAVRNINEYIGTTADDIELLALPVSHSFGLGRLRCCLAVGATLIMQGSFVNVKRIFRFLSDDGVTGFSMVPASWRFLQSISGDQIALYAKNIRYIEMGSAYFSADDKRHLARLFPNARVIMHYGLTEASRSAFMEFHEDAARLESVGKPSPHTSIEIFDDKGNMQPAGIEGEICIRGEHVTHGYLNFPKEHAFWGDYFRTGDWGYKDAEGYIYLKSRIKEIINVGGNKVSPVEVEEQLSAFKGIADCVCIGVPDPNGILGEVVKAYIVPDGSCSLDFGEISRFLTGKLEGYMIPAVYELIDAIPRTQNGKIRRNILYDRNKG